MNHCTKEQLIAFERRIADLWEAGELPYLIHLSGGNEDQLIEIFREVQPGDWVFSTHRNHYHALLSGMDPARLEHLIRTGDSMFVFERRLKSAENAKGNCPECNELLLEANLGGVVVDIYCENCGWPDERRTEDGVPRTCQVNFISSSILAGTCAIAAGVAWEVRRQGSEGRGREPHVWCFLGDGAEEEGHFYEAASFVHGHDLPCTFVVEDNNRSVDTNVEQRRGKNIYATLDEETTIIIIPPLMLGCIRRYTYTPTYPHAGSGCKHQITFKKL